MWVLSVDGVGIAMLHWSHWWFRRWTLTWSLTNWALLKSFPHSSHGKFPSVGARPFLRKWAVAWVIGLKHFSCASSPLPWWQSCFHTRGKPPPFLQCADAGALEVWRGTGAWCRNSPSKHSQPTSHASRMHDWVMNINICWEWKIFSRFPSTPSTYPAISQFALFNRI